MMDNQQNISNDTFVFFARRYTGLNICMGIIIILIGFMTVAVTGRGAAPIGVGVFFIVISILRSNTPYITIGEDNLAIKIAPARSTVYILFSEITAIEENHKKITVFYKIHGHNSSSEKKLAIVLKMMDDEEINRFTTLFKNKFAAKYR